MPEIGLSILIVSIIFLLAYYNPRRLYITHFLETGKCPLCGSFSSHKTNLSVLNQDYHYSYQDVCCNLYCTCTTDNIFIHLYHNKSKDKYLYDLALAFKRKDIKWIKEYEANGDLDFKKEKQLQDLDKKQAKEKGII